MPTPPNDVLLNKAAIIERCIRRIKEEYAASPDLRNQTHVDALTLNIERACQAAIDMSMHLVSTGHLGLPQNSAEAFDLLRKGDLIPTSLAKSLRAMTGFRNVAIHEYQELDTDILHYIAREGYLDFVKLCTALGMTIVAQPGGAGTKFYHPLR
ncbi:hypothetical protein PDESU_02278 [Pontiella desulfatans]|uniref:DUF86 domain-containing protein n=1 Tax=Pontiella desulfatans TaxID=2750659 RepID=A0A6C2U2B5_PONDE|nr:DUF86 domain-containing protein [Pontiella desulfatans]VGO13721.1 hypothetical protein PDESU_02278 [Pontiella desulfatans]